MKKYLRVIAAVSMAGMLGVIPVMAEVACAPAEVQLKKSVDGTKYEAVYDFDASDIPAGKKLTLIPDSTDKIGEADLIVSFSHNPITHKTNAEDADAVSQITFTSTGFSEPGDYSAAKKINGYLSDDYKADEIPVLKDFEYETNAEYKGSVTLTKYTGTNPKVVIYPQYHIGSVDSDVYDTIVGITRYDTVIEGWGSNFENGEYTGTDPDYVQYTIGEGVFAGNTNITSVTFLDGVKIGDHRNYMIQSDNIYEADNAGEDPTYHGYRFDDYGDDGEKLIQNYLDEVDSHGNAVYKDIDGRATVTEIEGPDMKGMFTGCTSLVEVKNIPDDVVKMTNTFRGCTSLTTVTNLPSELLDMEKTFMDCSSLVDVPQIPEKVVNMLATFRDCKSLNPENALYIPSSVRNFMETFENCNVMEKTPIISSKMQVRNLYYTFYRCKKMAELPVLPESAVSMFRTFYGCESASKTVNDTPHVIGNNGSDIPIDLIDTYRGCKSLNADIYIDMNKQLERHYVLKDGTGYNISYQKQDDSGSVSVSYDNKSYAELFSDNTWLYNCYDYNKLYLARFSEVEDKILEEHPGASNISASFKADGDRYAINTAYRQQEPKGMFWEAALSSGSAIRLHIPDNAGFEINSFNFMNGSRSVDGANGATGITGLNISRFDTLPVLNGNEDTREREETSGELFDEEYRIYTFNLSYHVEKNEEKLDSIEITTPPDKTEYEDGENFDKTGMVVTAVYRLYVDDVATDTYSRKVVTDYTTDKGVLNTDDDKVVVSYQGKTANQPVTVTKAAAVVAIEGVLKGADNQPLVGYKVELHSNPQTTITDENGRYCFENVETGEHTLYVYDKANKECGSILIHAKPGESDARPGNEESMDFDVTVSKQPFGDTIYANGVLKIKETETKPGDESTKPDDEATKPSDENTNQNDESADESDASSDDEPQTEPETKPDIGNVSRPGDINVISPGTASDLKPGADTDKEAVQDVTTPDTGDKKMFNIIVLLLIALAAFGCGLAKLKMKNVK